MFDLFFPEGCIFDIAPAILLPQNSSEMRGLEVEETDAEMVVSRRRNETNENSIENRVDGGEQTATKATDYARPEGWKPEDLQALVKLLPLEFRDLCDRTRIGQRRQIGLSHEARVFLFLLRDALYKIYS